MKSATKKTLFVSIFGPRNSGKTTLMRLFRKFLEPYNFDVQTSWEIDSPPETTGLPDFKLKAIAEKTKIVLVETQQKKLTRQNESPDDYEVKVQHVLGIGYIVSVTVAGVTLEHNFGDRTPLLKERARSTAARLANELGVEVVDTIPTEYDRVQAPMIEY